MPAARIKITIIGINIFLFMVIEFRLNKYVLYLQWCKSQLSL